MSNWAYAPTYRLYIQNYAYDHQGHRGQKQTWSIRSMQQAQALLTTGQGVNQMSVVVADPDGTIARTVQPRPMQGIELWTTNRFGQSGLCWRGYIDAVSRQFDPQQGDNLTITATGPVKLFEITSQTPNDAAAIALAYGQNITGSAVLRYAAAACGYPASMLRIHPQADSGSGYQAINGAIFTTPDQQKWSSVVSAVQSNAGIEWFFDEAGFCYWRQIGFITPWFGSGYAGRPAKIVPRVIHEDDILHADFTESDQGVVTRVEVRYYGGGGVYQTAQTWQAPASMENHLRTRLLVVYAPWITGADGARYLAGVLGAQYSAGVATASVTIPADPLIGIGSLVTVPALGVDGSTTYYVSSATYQLGWGAQWVCTLGLTYGRHPHQQFPYVRGVNYPVLTDRARQDLPSSGAIQSLDATNQHWDLTAYPITTNRVVTKTQVATGAYSPGATIQVWTKARGQGRLIGPTSNGQYTVVKPFAGQAPNTLALASASVTTGYVTIIDPGSDLSNNPDQGGTTGVTGTSGGDTTAPNGTGFPSGTVTTLAGPPAPNAVGSLAQRALVAAEHRQGMLYTAGHAGEDAFDCSGLVAASYRDCGLSALISLNGGGSYNTDVGPNGVYDYFAGRGAKSIDPSVAAAGDLLFIVEDTTRGDLYSWVYAQRGFSHVAFCSGPGQNFGANGPNGTHNIGYSSIGDFKGLFGTPFNRALRMASINVSR